jgi:putative membrane protein
MRSRCATSSLREAAMAVSDAEFTPTLRLHPLSWLFVLVASIRQFIVPVLAVVIFGARDDGSMWGMLFVIPLVLAAIWRQFLFRYGFGPSGLVIRDGLMFRNVRQIEYERIENVDTERNLLHRLLNVAEVRVQSSTGGKPEATIRVLGLAAVDELRSRIFMSGRAGAAPATMSAPGSAGNVLLKLSPAELMRFGFVDNRGMLVVAAAFGVVSQSGAMREVSQFLGRHVYDVELGSISVMLAVAAAGALIALFLVVRLLSLLWALVTLHDFTLTQVGTDLRVRYGLLTSIALTLRLQRIQAAHQTESVLHRFFGRVSLAVDLAGDGAGTDENGVRQQRVRWLAPICTPRRSAELIRTALPMLANDGAIEWQPLAPGARGRIFRRSVTFWSVVLAAPAIFFLHFEAPLLWLLLVPLAWLHASKYVHHTRWALTREAVLFHRGWLTRRLSIVPRNRIQAVQHGVSPFDRRAHMAVVAIDTAGAGSTSSILRIPYLPEESARELADALYRSARDFTLRSPSTARLV